MAGSWCSQPPDWIGEIVGTTCMKFLWFPMVLCTRLKNVYKYRMFVSRSPVMLAIFLHHLDENPPGESSAKFFRKHLNGPMDPEHIRPVPARAGSDQDCRVCMRCCWHPTDPATNVLSWQFFGWKILGGFSLGFLIDIVDMIYVLMMYHQMNMSMI